MKDSIIRGTAKDGQVRFFAAVTTELAEEARIIHDCSPVAAAALGRMLTAASMMGTMLKNEKDIMTIQINGGGEAGPILVTGNSKGWVKGYISNPHIYRPLNEKGKLDVGGAVGKDGKLMVIKDMGLKEPYVGQVPIVSGEIAEDITYYFAVSEQVPSAVSLGVLVDTDNKVIAAGGFILQMMPEAEDRVRDILEYRLDEIPPVTTAIYEKGGIDVLLDELLDGMSPQVLEKYEPRFACDCSTEKIKRVLISLGEEELRKLADEDEKTEVNCHFCNKKYTFTSEEIYNLLKEAGR